MNGFTEVCDLKMIRLVVLDPLRTIMVDGKEKGV